MAWVVLWFMATRFPCKVPVTANSQDQLRDIVWPTLAHWHRLMPGPLRNEFDCRTGRLVRRAAEEDSVAVARTATVQTPEALQGFHSPNLLYILEEASAIPEKVIEVAHGALSTAGSKVLMVGNPTRGSGFFFDAFHGLRERWSTLHVSSLDVPYAQGHADDVAARYGEESNVYRVRVLGEFPVEDTDVVIPLHLVEAALRREVEPLAEHHIYWGVDVARFGDDASALAKRQANRLIEPVKTWRNKDTMQVAGIIKNEYEATIEEGRPKRILVDSIGIGAGVEDRLRELGLPASGVNVAERPAADERYSRLRDELWFKAREWFEERGCVIPDDAALIAELTDVRYDFASNGKIKVEAKDDMKQRNPQMGSPDRADAFVLTFAGGLERKPDDGRRDRYSGKRRGDGGGAWAA